MTDTIFAPATAPGRAALAVVRISGPGAKRAVISVSGAAPEPRSAALKTLRDARGGAIDQALVLWFPAPASYTGEDCAEFHVHGGPAVTGALLTALTDLGLRLAEPGEFTRRAFEHGKLDLAQAEGVADLVDAETDAQRRQALAQLEGRLSQAQAGWRDALTDALAILEAAVDFPDEEVPADVAAQARPILTALIADLQAAQADAQRGQRVREGFRIALIGAPNAGKSTLLNALAAREAAIVTATPGTTRDIIEVPLELAGYKVLLADTAGLRETDEAIEAEGVRRARAWANSADLRLWVVDRAGERAPVPAELQAGDICILAKQDLPSSGVLAAVTAAAAQRHVETIPVSALNATSLEALRGRLSEIVVAFLDSGEPPTATRLRHSELLREATGRLNQALDQSANPELAAEDVRLAARALERITGRIDPETVLGRIFASFCIGK